MKVTLYKTARNAFKYNPCFCKCVHVRYKNKVYHSFKAFLLDSDDTPIKESRIKKDNSEEILILRVFKTMSGDIGFSVFGEIKVVPYTPSASTLFDNEREAIEYLNEVEKWYTENNYKKIS